MGIESLFLVGVNHLRAPVNCREKLAVPPEEMPETLQYLRHLVVLEEIAVLSTCSRMEVVGVSREPLMSVARTQAWFLNRGGSEIGPSHYLLRGPDAVRHLFRVASGLDSWIVGESEILGQVKRAYHAALEEDLTGRTLNRLFQQAIGAGKTVRSSTGIQNGIHSIGGAAALLARRIFGESRGGKVVVFGAGQAAQAVVRHLAAKDFNQIYVANRTVERARTIAELLSGHPMTIEEGLRMLVEAEIGVFSAASPHPLLTSRDLDAVLRARRRPLFLIDLGLPRNIASDCLGAEGAYIYDLDSLKDMVQASLDRKAEEKKKAEALAEVLAEACCAELDKSTVGLKEQAGSLTRRG